MPPPIAVPTTLAAVPPLAASAAFVTNGNHRRLIEHNAFATNVDQRVGGTEVDSHIAGKITAQESEHGENGKGYRQRAARAGSRIGNRIINGLDTPDGAEKRRAYQEEYQRKYRARIALAKRRGLLKRDE